MGAIEQVASAVEAGKLKNVAGLVEEALGQGCDALDILNGMISAMSVVGEKFKNNEIFVPEMLVAARTMKSGVEILKPKLSGDKAASIGKFIIGTVSGDLHDIGKNLVGMMAESSGFEVVDLGIDVPSEKFVQAAQDNPDCKIIGISALLTTTMQAMRSTVQALTDAATAAQAAKTLLAS